MGKESVLRRACRAFKVEKVTAREWLPGALSYDPEERTIARERVSAGLSASLQSAGVDWGRTHESRAEWVHRPFHGLHIKSRVFLAWESLSVTCKMPYTQ